VVQVIQKKRLKKYQLFEYLKDHQNKPKNELIKKINISQLLELIKLQNS